MKKDKYLSLLITMFFAFFGLITTVSATATCSYGIEHDGQWYKMLDIKINGYDDYEMSYQSSYYQAFIEHGINKCDGSCEDKSIGGYRINYYTEFSEEFEPDDLSTGSDILDNIPLLSTLGRYIKYWAEEGEFSTLVTYSINLYATANAYSIVGEYDICPNNVYVYYSSEANSYASQWFGDADHDNVISYFIFKDDITKMNNKPKDGLGHSIDVDADSKLQLLECDGGVCKPKTSAEYTEYSDCGTYNDYMYVLEHLKNENGGSCSESEEFTEAYRELADLCDKYSSSTNYTDENGENVKSCMKACSGLKDDIQDLCDYDDSSSITQQCRSFGDRTIAWIFKIINMVRYLVPVVLIVLSVLDFIKTVATDDEGEIRKSGTRFIKRLIAAALIFIVPLILQFVLNIFNIPGLDPNNPFCVLFLKF